MPYLLVSSILIIKVFKKYCLPHVYELLQKEVISELLSKYFLHVKESIAYGKTKLSIFYSSNLTIKYKASLGHRLASLQCDFLPDLINLFLTTLLEKNHLLLTTMVNTKNIYSCMAFGYHY